MALKRVRLGRIYAHPVTFPEAVEEVAALVNRRLGGYVVTPNVDHVVQAEHSEALASAYGDASLSVVDGQPLMWLSRLMGTPFPQKISGSDLVPELMRRAAHERWRVLFLGAAEGVGAKAAEVLRRAHPDLQIIATLCPRFGFDEDPEERASVLREVCNAKADLIIMALGCPKQELLMHAWKEALAPAVAIGSGATLDFIAGNVSRSPTWMSDAGLEWLYRLAREPTRLAHRYLVRDPEIIKIAWDMMRLPPEARVVDENQTGGR